MDGKHWAKVSKRGITGRKGAKIENPYLNAHVWTKVSKRGLTERTRPVTETG